MEQDRIITLDISKDNHFLRFNHVIKNLPKSCEELILKGRFIVEGDWHGRLAMIGDSNMSVYSLVEAIKNLPKLRVLDMSQCEDIDHIYDGFSHLNIEKIVLPKGVKKLPSIYYCDKLKEIVGEGLIEISSIHYCPNIEKVTYNTKATRVELNNTKITSAIITKHLKYFTFSNCSELFNLTIEPGVESLPSGTFANCKGLREIFIPDNVCIGERVFQNCENLSKVRLPNDMIELPESLFEGCRSLCKIEGGENVTNISKHCFIECSNLNSLPFKINDFNEEQFSLVKNDLLGVVLSTYNTNLIWCFDDFSFYHFKGILDSEFKNKIVTFTSQNNVTTKETDNGTEIVRCLYKNAEKIKILEEYEDVWTSKGKAVNAFLHTNSNGVSSIKDIYDEFKKQVESLDIKNIISSYKTYVRESQTWKVGGDNTYHYYKKTSCEYLDAYLKTLLPQFDEEYHESACHDYSDEIDPDIESKQIAIDEKIKKDAYKNYSKDEHVIFLIDDYLRNQSESSELIENALHIGYAKHIVNLFFNYTYKNYKHNETIGYLCKSNIFGSEWLNK